MSTKKYEIVKSESIVHKGRTLYRIKALKTFCVACTAMSIVVKKGELGGFVESENNLSQEGTCWIYGKAKVYGDAKVSDGAAKIDDKLNLNKGKYIFATLNIDETLSEIEPICYKISFAVRVIELKLPIEQGYIESLVSELAKYDELIDYFHSNECKIIFTPNENKIYKLLLQSKQNTKNEKE